MIKFTVRKKLNRLIAGALSVAMVMTMVPDIWLPIYAESVRNDILNADIISGEDIISDDFVDEANNVEVNNDCASQNIKYEYNGHTYSVINIAMKWSQAKEYCENIGGHLATITDNAENDFITGLTYSNGSCLMYWLGGYRDGAESEWKWITGEPFQYANWDYGEPNYDYEHYIHIYGDNSVRTAGKWNNYYDSEYGDTWSIEIKNYFICEWDNVEESTEENYTVFSGSDLQGISLYGWKSCFTGNIYTGNNFIYGGSELYVNGKIDAAGTIAANGWITEITEQNEFVNAISMPDYDEAIEDNAQPYEYFEESPAYVQDRNIVNSSIKVGGEVIISGTTFEGDCYIIADGNITYNVQDFKSTGRVFLYSKNGNITINGSQININGAMYAPKGNVTFNTYDTTVTGFVCADTINFNGSLFNITGANFDMVNGASEIPTETSILSQGNPDYGYKIEFVEDEWSLGNNTTFGSRMIELVPDRNYMNGHSYYKIGKLPDEDFSFSARFTFSTDYTSSRADGFAFVMQPTYNVSGGSGGGIGYRDIDPSVVVEFDNYYNKIEDGDICDFRWKDNYGCGEWKSSEGNEYNDNHIGIMINGNIGDHYAICDYEPLRKDGSLNDAWIEYDGVNKIIYVSAAEYDENGNVYKPVKPLIACKIDISEIFAGQEYIYFGITSATGESRASHKLHGVEFDPNPDVLYYYNNYPEDENEPEIAVTSSAATVTVGEEAYFKVTLTAEEKITAIKYTLNGKKVTLSEGGAYVLDTTVAGKYELIAEAETAAGKTITASASINVEGTSEIDIEAPTVELSFDKEAYSVGDTIIAEIIAEDNIGVSRLEAFVNDEEVEIDENNCIKIENAAEGEYTFTANAYDEAGNMGTATYTVTIVIDDTEAPTVTITFDKDTYLERDDIIFTVTAEDNIGVTRTVVTVDGTEVNPDADGNYSIKNAELKTYEITASAYDEAGNMGTATANVPVNEASAPVITVVFDKESYSEGDDLSALITAEGQREIKEIRVLVNGEEKSLDESGILTIENVVAGEYVFNITAEDVKGFTSECEKTVPVSPIDTEDKRLTAEIEPFVEYGETALLTIKITDDINAESVKAVLDDKEISLTDELTYEFKAEELFNHDFVITAQTNDGETIEKEVSVYVIDSICPTMTITYDKPDGYYEGDDIVATIVAEDNIGIKRIEYTYDGVEYPIDENGNVTIPKIHVDTHAVVATAWDTFGNSITLTSAFIVVYDDVSGEEIITTEDDVDDTELVCKIYTPKDGQTVTSPISIVGTAAGTEFKSYKLEYAPVGTKNYTLIKEGTEAVNANILGKLDPTLLNNGLYNLKLTVYSEKKNVSSEIVISVEGNMKIGNFSIAFQDMDVNVAGLPLTVIRSYDSRSRNTKDDFGYGWDMSTSGVKINESCNMAAYWQINMEPLSWGFFKYSVTGTRSHIVTINYGNGKTEKFEMQVVVPSNMSRPQYGVDVNFKPLNGSKSKLEIVGASNLFLDSDWLGSYSQLDYFSYTSYRFTTQDGTVYIIDRKGEVESITEPNGNKITFNKDGIIHSDGKSIVFNRDSEDRITSIVSPTGKTVTYTYDENGDLSSVTDVSGEVTRFVYENHYLTEIIDPRGVRVSKNIYDDDGRLIKTIDADGNEIKYDHDINGREERVTDRNGNVTRYVYDQNGNILSQTDPNGNTVKNTYDSNGNISSKTDAMGNVTNYNYDSSGNMLSMTDAEGHSVSNSYNSKGQLTSINAMGINAMTVQYDSKGNTTSTTDALGNDINYSYDSKGQLTSVTDEIGTYMNMTYDSDGNVVSATNGAGTTAQFTYDSDGNCTSKTLTYTSESGVKTVTEQYFYDAAGNLTKIIDSEGNVTTTDYNSMGKVSSATDEKGRTTTYDYDDFGNLIGISYPDGTSERFTYDREGNNLTATDRMGRTVTMTYDKVGNLLSKTYPNGARVTYSYDANYNLVSETSASGGVTYYEYDKIGRNTAITDALGNRTAFSYNAKSQLESMTDPMGRVYTYIYDDNGNRIKTVYPDGSSVSSEYDARGRVTRQTDQHGYSTRYAYDGGDRLTGVTNAQGVSTSYAYDEVGNMTSVTDENGNVTRYSYDDFGRVIMTTNALGNSAYTTYDESGNVLTSTDYAGNMTTYTYDNFDRVLSKTTPDGVVSYTYTTDGKLSTVTDNSGVTMFTYDNMDGLTRVDYPDGNYVAYSYDNACRLTKVSTPFGTTSYEYDMLDRLTRVIDRNGYATIYEYDANGNRTAVRYANGLTVSYDYDLLNRLIRQETLDNDGEVVVQYIYTLGAAGERLSVAELGRTVEYTYDNLYRLTGETITEGEKVTVYTYAYDSVGNRILKTKNGTETVYTYNELNQLVSDSDATYEYDLNGNLVRVIGGAQSALYEYNSENKLIKATVQSGSLVTEESYTYDYAGNRTSKTTYTSDGNFEVVKYLNDNSSLTNVLAELDSEGNVQAYYTIGADLISQERNGRTYTYLYDGHGSVVGLADEGGSVTDTYTYDAFGNLLKSTGRTANNYRYCGEQFDSTTGLYYLRARYMDTSTGRFISQDSYAGSIDDPVSLHKYLYANSNPVMYSDPSGYFVDAVISWAAENEYNAAVLKLGLEIIAALTVSAGVAYAKYSIDKFCCENIDLLTSGFATSQVLFDALRSFVISEVNAKVKSGKKSETYPLNSVYVLTDYNGKVKYVGRTNEPGRREKEHEKDLRKQSFNFEKGEFEKWKMTVIYSELSPDEARVREQFLIATYSLDNLKSDEGGNQRREIAPKNVGLDRYSDAITDLCALYGGYVEDEIIEYMRGNY